MQGLEDCKGFCEDGFDAVDCSVEVTCGLEESGFVEAHYGGDFADVNDTHISTFA